MAALTTIAAFAALGAAGGSLMSSMRQKKPAAPASPGLPPAVDPVAAMRAQEAAITARQGKARVPGGTSGRASTILTGPSGLATPTQSGAKTLLGM